MRQLKHKNITELLEFIETDEFYFIILELCPGGELFHQIVKLTYFSEDLSRHVIVQVAEAVRYLHEEAGVVHRDIKPENLLFYPIPIIPSKVKEVRPGESEDKEDEGEFTPGVGSGGIGTIKLADFGLSKIIWDTKTMTPCGTVGYTAPEIVNDQRYSKSVDMWALGCVLYTILCGFPPFYDESIQTLTEKVAKGQYTFLSPWWDSISDSAKDLVSHLLTVDPERRYTIEQFLQHPWITQGKTTAPPVPPKDTKLDSIPEPDQFAKPVDTATMAFGDPEVALTAGAGHTPGAIPNHAEKRADKKALISPAIAMKEAFDVFNAVHRMEEESVRNRMNKNVLMEEDEDDEDDNLTSLSNKMAQTNLASKRHQRNPTPSQVKSAQADSGFFELSLDSATLLGRRKKGGAAAAGGAPAAATQAPPTAPINISAS